MKFTCLRCLVLFFVCSVPVCASDIEEQWQTIWMAGERVGYAHATVVKQEVDGTTRVVSDSLAVMKIVRFGQSLSMRQLSHVEESLDGKLLRFTSTMENPPNSKSTTSGVFDGGTLVVTTVAGGQPTTKAMENLDGILSVAWPERYLREGKLEEGGTTSFEVFEPQLGQKIEVTVQDATPAESSDHVVLLTQNLAGTPIETRATFDDQWNSVNAVTPLINMEFRTCTEQEALAPIKNVSFDFATDTMIKVKDLRDPFTAKSVTYRVHVAGADAQQIFRATHSYMIQNPDGEQVDLVIPRPVEDGGFTISEPGDEFLLPSPVVECDDPLIHELAWDGAPADEKPEAVAIQLKEFVRGYVQNKNFSTSLASALETARSRSGDCTEHAVLLTGLLRARKIPARVVIGFVYAPEMSAFVGHMWTEAWLDGRWVALDATRPDKRVGQGHLAVTTSSLADQGNVPAAEFLPILHLLGRTEIEVLEVAR